MHVCKDCKERHVGCHSDCEKYNQAKKAKDEFNEKVRSAKLKYYEERKMIHDGIQRCSRRH